MDVDESFAEYVSVRWSMLYRLATLLAGPAQQELIETALPRAYVAWREVEHASPDATVKKILANTAIEIGRWNPGRADRPASGTDGHSFPHEAAVVDRERLWPRIVGLPAQERVAIVLLYYEDLSEAEIGHMLGCSTDKVKAHAFAALATVIDTGGFTTSDLREELVRRADEVAVPFPPVDLLVSRGREERRRRGRRSFAWAAAVAVVAVIGVTLASVVGGAEPDRPGSTTGPTTPPAALPGNLTDLPTGRPPDIAYSTRRVLHVQGHEIALTARPSAIAQTPDWVFVAFPNGRIVQVSTETAGVETLIDAGTGSVVTDPSGTHVAWLLAGNQEATVVLREVDASGAAPHTAEQTFPATPRCCDNPFVLNGITQDGDLVGSLPAASKAWVWDTRDGGTGADTDSDLREIEGLGNGSIDQVTVDGIVIQYPPSHYAVGSLEDGVFLVTGEFTARTAYFGDPLGRRLVYVDDSGETHVRTRVPRRGRRVPVNVRLQLPLSDAGFTSARWEDDAHVLLDVFDNYLPDGALVRCDVVTGACELASRFDGPHLLAE